MNLADPSEEIWDRVIDTNLKGTFFCSVEAARLMRAGGGGSIVNVSSVVAARGLRNLAAYAASKGGINALTIQLAVELAPDQIRVNAFAPGATNVQRNLDDDPSYRETWAPLIPLGRIAEPEDMVGPTVFLASEESSHVTGQLFYVDGGWTVGRQGSRGVRRPRGTPAASRALIPPPPLRRNRDFVLLLTGRLLSTLGSQVTAIAYPLLVLAVTHSPAKAGIVGFAGLLPHGLFGLPAGVAADRWNRKRLMIAADGVRALAIASSGRNDPPRPRVVLADRGRRVRRGHGLRLLQHRSRRSAPRHRASAAAARGRGRHPGARRRR